MKLKLYKPSGLIEFLSVYGIYTVFAISLIIIPPTSIYILTKERKNHSTQLQ